MMMVMIMVMMMLVMVMVIGDGDGYICQQYRERAMHSKVITAQIQPKSSFFVSYL